ncbi:MAG TPA: sugar phosphate isomerase/epimerase family protein [Gemmatimonadales bacterium]|nr:sugar phosphate isomerase/epimerase family protein [Gemmatimonadales bacterium]
MSSISRRDFLASTAAFSAMSMAFPGRLPVNPPAPLFRISLAEWSFHKALQGKQMDNLDFAKVAKQEFGLEAIEYVNVFFKDKSRDAKYLAELNTRARGEGVYQHLIMIDGEGDLGDPDPAKRAEAVANHVRWVEAAKTLGCATIRVNAGSNGTPEEQQKLAADGLRQLCEKADPFGINVIVENHGGLSSHGDWLAGVMRLVNHPRVGTLPDFGNFYEYDRYKGVAEMMPFAKAVSAKSNDFDAQGNETTKDYRRLLKIVLDAGFHGWIGIEYEGDRLPERDGVRATLRLLEKVRAEFQKA